MAFFERCVALLPNFRENPPRYVLNHFTESFQKSQHSCRKMCCFSRLNRFLNYYSMVLKRVLSYWHIHWNMVFQLWKIFVCKVCSITVRKCSKSLRRFRWWCKNLFKHMCCLFSSKYCTTFSNMSFKRVQLFYGHVVLFWKGCYVTFKRSSKCAISYLCRILLKTTQSKL